MQVNSDEAARLRTEYESEGLSEADMSDDPFSQFDMWFSGVLAAGLEEPNAFVLATADGEGKPSARAVLMKGFSEEGLVFYTNMESRKSSELRENPAVAATFVWTPLHRQVRFEGDVEALSAQLAEDYFASRPRGAQIAAHASAQSSVVSGREELEARFAKLSAEFGEDDIPRPADWGGWRIVPDCVEFWQGRPDRFHDRVRYRQDGEGWEKERLAP